MKLFLTLGGCTGFALVFGSSIHAGNPPAYALRDGAVGCLAGALLLRALHWSLLASIRSHLATKNSAAQARAVQSDAPLS